MLLEFLVLARSGRLSKANIGWRNRTTCEGYFSKVLHTWKWLRVEYWFEGEEAIAWIDEETKHPYVWWNTSSYMELDGSWFSSKLFQKWILWKLQRFVNCMNIYAASGAAASGWHLLVALTSFSFGLYFPPAGMKLKPSMNNNNNNNNNNNSSSSSSSNRERGNTALMLDRFHQKVKFIQERPTSPNTDTPAGEDTVDLPSIIGSQEQPPEEK